ncbi:MAG: 3-dehydroquinate synthase [Burkholderiales bacterium]|nr:3-dehydroquinate synthase [Burkholderiales bacterium]
MRATTSATPPALADTTPAPRSTRVDVDTPGGRYEIRIGPGLIAQAQSWSGLPRSADAVIVSNPTIWALHGSQLCAAVAPHHRRVTHVLLPDGEEHKAWPALQRIYDHLLGTGCDRKTLLYALGGGVVGDITGFAAATYMRGVPFVQVPTTLLAQVDSSVGGKTAINHPLGKNMIGAFHQPLRVVCDLATLQTLPRRELVAGLAEVIKYGPIYDDGFLGWIEQHLDALLAGDADALMLAIQRSCEIKAAVVGADERESGQRAILNFGHTFGHAIEAGLGFGTWLHGEAVGCGMVLAGYLSAELGLVPPAYAERIERLVARAGLPTRAPAMPDARWLDLMRHDKKAEAGEIRFVLIEAPGRAGLRPAADDRVLQVIRRHSEAAPAGGPGRQ